MSRKHSWLLLLVVLVMLVAACGPQMATPTARIPDEADSSSTAAPADDTVEPEPSSGDTEGVKPSAYSDLPVSTDDWHVLGSPDAPVTIVEYSDFQ